MNRRIVGALLLAIVLGAATDGRAAVRAAASCSASDVQAALNQALDGDTVQIPAGTCGWSGPLQWSAPPNVTVLGAGNLAVRGGGDATVIVDNIAGGSPLWWINVSTVGKFRLAGLTIRESASAGLKETAVLVIAGSAKQVRLDHLHIDMRGGQYSTKPLRFIGDMAGVLDSSIIDLGGIGWVHFQGGGENGDESWARDTGFGSSDFVFIEDNQVNSNVLGATLSDCNAGGKFVVRNNSVVGAAVGQTHPTGGSGRGRGCRAHEVYGNVVTQRPGFNPATDQPQYAFEWLSSGTAVIWGNTANNVYKYFIAMIEMRKNNGTYSQTATPNGWGYCGTAFNGQGSAWDGNNNASNGYPCLDQPTRGRGDLLAGQFPNAVNTRTGTISWPNQRLEPLYEFLNQGTVVSGWGGSYLNNDSNGQLVENRDYYLRTASFTGASGVGVGPIANRPTVCTTGVAYWATDQGEWNSTNGASPDGKMYVCTASNTWTARYGGDPSNTSGVPYPYPHPLRQTGGVPPPQPPDPATSVRVVH
jgi:hypothetical protein